MRFKLLGIAILVRLLQPLNAESPMRFTLFGIVMLVRLLQFLNALVSMAMMLSGMVIETKSKQSSKAKLSIKVTLLPLYVGGISTLVKNFLLDARTDNVPSALLLNVSELSPAYVGVESVGVESVGVESVGVVLSVVT